MTLPAVPPRDPQAGRLAEAERLHRIVERPFARGFWTTDQLVDFELWRRHAAALQDAPRNRPFVMDGITWRFKASQ